jgi:hypothetical protein
MSQPRRRFLQQLALATAALACGRAELAQAGTKAVGGSGYSAFEPLVGHDFVATHAGGTTAVLKLAGISRPRSLKGYPDPAKAREQCFTLVFEGDAAMPLPEQTYTLSAIGAAPFEAFMSPLGDGGRRYQVVFNRI